MLYSKNEEDNLIEKRTCYQQYLDDENFQIWSKSQLKSKLRAIDKKLAVITSAKEYTIIRTKEDAENFAVTFAHSKACRNKMASAEIPLPNAVGEPLILKKRWGESYNVYTKSGVSLGDFSIQIRSNGNGLSPKEVGKYLSRYMGENTHMENALVTCTADVKVTFKMSAYVPFKENYSDEEKRKLVTQKVYENLYDKFFSTETIAAMETDSTNLNIEFIDKVVPGKKDWKEDSGLRNNEIKKDVFAAHIVLQTPDKPLQEDEEERKVA